MTAASDVQFPTPMPGVHEQRQPGLLKQRVKISDGTITPTQLRTLAELALRFSAGYPLHLTTRQNIEFHGVAAEELPALQAGIADVGLTASMCGKTVRSITVCPGSGICEGSRHLGDLRQVIETHARALPFIGDLPSKFKISLSGCSEACARPWISDLGLVANGDGSLTVVIAGSLGAHPQTGMLLCDALQPADVLPFVTAALRLFHAEGDRENRRRSRLRHVRERLGDDVFRKRLQALFEQERAAGLTSVPDMPLTVADPPELAHLVPPLGDISPDQAIELADVVASQPNGGLRLGLEHDLFVNGVPAELLPSWCADMIGVAPIVVCPGNTWCEKAVAESRRAATFLRGVVSPHSDLSIAISGCPNNCAHAAVADIGLVGSVKRVNGVPTDHYRLLVGGERGAGSEMAREVHPAVPVSDVRRVVGLLVEDWFRADKPAFGAWARANAGRLAGILRAPGRGQ